MTRQRLMRRLATGGRVVAAIAAVFGVVWVASATFTSLGADVERNAAAVKDHEGRLRTVEGQVGQIATDVRWIRETIEKQQPSASSADPPMRYRDEKGQP